jgi:hypothetical protein
VCSGLGMSRATAAEAASAKAYVERLAADRRLFSCTSATGAGAGCMAMAR